jgi:hypothetical protein
MHGNLFSPPKPISSTSERLKSSIELRMEWTFVTDSREVGDGPDAASGESSSSYADSGMLAERLVVLGFADDEDIVGSNAGFSSEKAVRSSVRADGSP